MHILLFKHVCAILLTLGNSLYSFGYNAFGQLGIGNQLYHEVPQEITYFKENNIKIYYGVEDKNNLKKILSLHPLFNTFFKFQ